MVHPGCCPQSVSERQGPIPDDPELDPELEAPELPELLEVPELLPDPPELLPDPPELLLDPPSLPGEVVEPLHPPALALTTSGTATTPESHRT